MLFVWIIVGNEMSTKMLYLSGLMLVLTDQIKVELMFVFPLNPLWLFFDFPLEGYSASRMFLFHQSRDTLKLLYCRFMQSGLLKCIHASQIKIPMIHFGILTEKDEPI